MPLKVGLKGLPSKKTAGVYSQPWLSGCRVPIIMLYLGTWVPVYGTHLYIEKHRFFMSKVMLSGCM